MTVKVQVGVFSRDLTRNDANPCCTQTVGQRRSSISSLDFTSQSHWRSILSVMDWFKLSSQINLVDFYRGGIQLLSHGQTPLSQTWTPLKTSTDFSSSFVFFFLHRFSLTDVDSGCPALRSSTVSDVEASNALLHSLPPPQATLATFPALRVLLDAPPLWRSYPHASSAAASSP